MTFSRNPCKGHFTVYLSQTVKGTTIKCNKVIGFFIAVLRKIISEQFPVELLNSLCFCTDNVCDFYDCLNHVLVWVIRSSNNVYAWIYRILYFRDQINRSSQFITSALAACTRVNLQRHKLLVHPIN